MKILLVTRFFPPVNRIAAIRTGKMAEYFMSAGHDVRVVTMADDDSDRSLPCALGADRVIVTPFLDIDRWINPKSWIRRRDRRPKTPKPAAAASGLLPLPSLAQPLASAYRDMILYPDQYIGWTRHLLPELRRQRDEWRPDVVVASGPPFSSFLAVSKIFGRSGIPWVAELRDRWVDDPYARAPRWRVRYDQALERAVLRTAAGIVTVSDPWTQFYERKYRKPTLTVMNGFDPADFSVLERRSEPGGPLRILHMGTIYQDRRDPTPLFLALQRFDFHPEQVRVLFYGRDLDYAVAKANALGVGRFIEFHAPVPYLQSLEMQRAADILLLLQWNHVREQGNVPAKIFEYFAARRPILGIGLEEGVPASLIRERNAGTFSNDPHVIAKALTSWIAEKAQHGAPLDLPERASAGLTRTEQYTKLEAYLRQLVHEEGYRTKRGLVSFRQELRAEAATAVSDADTAALAKPVLSIVIDAEEDFDWREPFSRSRHGTDSFQRQYLAQEIFRKYSVKPTYVITHPIASDPKAVELLGTWHAAGVCEIGIQLHGWTTPPYRELLSTRNSYACNLDPDLVRAKLEALVTLVRQNLGILPKIYRGGRYGLDVEGLKIAAEFGIVVDTSVVPHSTFRPEGGPDFRGCSARPFFFHHDGRLVLELPLTRGFVGPIGDRAAAGIYRRFENGPLQKTRLIGVLSRLGLLQRMTLSPEGQDYQQLCQLTDALIRKGHKVLCLSYHSPSLGAANTPYVRSEQDVERFLNTLDRYLAYALETSGCDFMTPLELLSVLKPAAAGRP